MPFESTTLSWLVLAAVGLSAAALLVSLGAWRRAGRTPARVAKPARRSPLQARSQHGALPADEVANQLHELRADAATALRHVAVVRYDAFGDMGGHLSWSLALLDDHGDGAVLTSIHGRTEGRTYAKNIAGWSANQQLSPEESEAIGFARTTAA